MKNINLNKINFGACKGCYDYFIEDVKNNTDFVKYGKDNLTPQKLITLFENSNFHNSLVKGIVDLITGYGWEDKSKTSQFLQNQPNPDESLEDLIYKIAFDLKLFGGFYLKIVKSKNFKNKIAQIYHLPYQNIRIKQHNNKLVGFYHSYDWTKTRPEKTYYPSFNNNPDAAISVIQTNIYTPGVQFYSRPDYNGGIRYIEIDSEISNFHLNNIKNGFVGSYWINFNNGTPTEDEVRSIRRKLEGELTGTDNGGQMVITFSDTSDSKPDITPLQAPNTDKMYIELSKDTMQNIIVTHRVSPSLVGVMVAGQLGNNNPIENYEILNKFVITPFQHKIERTLIRLFNYNSDIEDSQFKIIPLDINYGIEKLNKTII